VRISLLPRGCSPSARRIAVNRLIEQHGFSQRRACRLVGIDHSTLRYQPRRAEDFALRQRLRELPAELGGTHV